MFVVDAPPDMVKRPLVIVDEALEKKPDGSVRNPAESKVEVAEPPKYALSKTENLVVEACVKDARPVKLLAPVNALMPVVVKFPATVELAWETNPLAKVARWVRLRVPAERTPMFPFVLKRFVLDAVVEKRLVVVALPSVTVPAGQFGEYGFVLDAVVEKRFVVVALVVEAFVAKR